jgi:3'-5' exoribonuclease
MRRLDEWNPSMIAMEAVYRKRIFCADLKVGDDVQEVFCVVGFERREGRSGSFLRLTLADRSGTLSGVAWDDIERLLDVLVEGGYARIRGKLDSYKGEPQIKVEAAESVSERLDPSEFLPRGPIEGELSLSKIRDLLLTMRDGELRRVVLAFLDDPAFAREFAEAPAAKTHHHAYVGGLAEHTLSVMRMCARAVDHYPELDRDLLLSGAFLHDIGKTRELAVEPGFPFTEEGALLGHIALGYAMLEERLAQLADFPAARRTDLGHLVLSHQGEYEWGSPVQPQTLEAIVLHFLDNLDSKVATARAHMVGVSGRTPYIRALGRALFRRGAPPVAPAEPGEGAPPPAETGGGPNPKPRPDDRETGPPSLFTEP